MVSKNDRFRDIINRLECGGNPFTFAKIKLTNDKILDVLLFFGIIGTVF
jgi:hypothetical protein